jgi:predicted dehydrogenase
MSNNRRKFIKELSMLAGSSLVLSASPWLQPLLAQEQTAGQKVRIGIIGVGKRGSGLIKHLQQVENADIIAVCDDYEPNFQNALKLTEGKAKGFYDYRRMLEMKELDAVVIATPVFLHPLMTVDALNAGKHVFVEKAMGIDIPSVKEMVTTQKNTGKCLQVGHQRMFDIRYLAALERVKKGEFGPITHIRSNWNMNNPKWGIKENVPPHLEKKLNWRMYNKYSMGLMGELISHQTQVSNWFIGELPEYVVGSGSLNYLKKGDRDTFDHVHVIYKYPSGAHFEATSILTNGHYGLEEQVMGPKGTYELPKGRYYTETPPPSPGIVQLITDIESKIFETIPIGGATWIMDTGSTHKGELLANEYPLPSSVTAQFEAFVQSVIVQKPMDNIIEQGYYATVAAIMGHEAMMTKKTVYMKEEYKI